MTAPRFRKGDVCRLEYEDERCALEVRDVAVAGSCNNKCSHHVLVSGGRTTLWRCSVILTLLRRPLHVGDQLRNQDGTTCEITTNNAAFCSARLAPGCTHADGTAIEVPPSPLKKGGTLHYLGVTIPSILPVAIPIIRPGSESRGEARPHFATRADVVAALTPHPLRINVDDLAFALFRTDDEVLAFVNRVSDWTAPGQRNCSLRSADDPRWARAMETAWSLDEHGWATRALNRAMAIADAMGAVRT